ncbi:DUF6338 family protein [Actinomadura rugatobispora]|uniref:DUF6338 family protein n=1 Tax=Actinomadura rugatobispora TaxID=1994 RepID=A0ABW0ZZ20_9ACTN
MNLTLLAHIVPLALVLLPGVHYDRLRRREPGRARRHPEPSQYGRVVLAGALVTAATLLALELLRLVGPRTLISLGEARENGALRVPSFGVMTWSLVCFLMISLTLASLAAAVLARLEDGSAAWQRAVRAAGVTGTAATRRWLEFAGRDVEVEVKLTCGDTYRGVYGDRSVDRARGVQYITLNGPIFEVDGHGRPLPLDALHWDHMLVPTRAITSLLVRPVDRREDPVPAAVPGAVPTGTVPGGMRSRHSIPRETLSCRAKAAARHIYDERSDPRLLTKLLATQVISIGFVGLLSGIVA